MPNAALSGSALIGESVNLTGTVAKGCTAPAVQATMISTGTATTASTRRARRLASYSMPRNKVFRPRIHGIISQQYTIDSGDLVIDDDMSQDIASRPYEPQTRHLRARATVLPGTDATGAID